MNDELTEAIKCLKCEVPEKPEKVEFNRENLQIWLLHIGRTNYNKAIDDVLNLIKDLN